MCNDSLKIISKYLNKSDEYSLTVKEVATERELPDNFLQKIAQDLAKWKLLESKRGRNGGVKLDRASNAITVRDVMKSVNGEYDHECIIGENSGAIDNFCHVCNHYYSHFSEAYFNTSLKDLLDKENCCKHKEVHLT